MTSRPNTTESPPFRFTATYAVAVLLSWLLPGAGHWILGYRVRGVLLGLVLISTFWVGETALGENQAVNRAVHPVFFGLQAGNGASALLAETLFSDPLHRDANQTSVIAGGAALETGGRFGGGSPGLPPLPRQLNLGILFCSVSGLLNMLIVLHILDPRTWREAALGTSLPPADPRPESGASDSGASS